MYVLPANMFIPPEIMILLTFHEDRVGPGKPLKQGVMIEMLKENRILS